MLIISILLPESFAPPLSQYFAVLFYIPPPLFHRDLSRVSLFSILSYSQSLHCFVFCSYLPRPVFDFIKTETDKLLFFADLKICIKWVVTLKKKKIPRNHYVLQWVCLKGHIRIGSTLNLLMPNDDYSCRTAPLTSKCCILYIYSTNIGIEYFKHGIYSPFFPLQNAVCFINLTYLVPVLFTFYIQGVLKFKKIITAPKG